MVYYDTMFFHGVLFQVHCDCVCDSDCRQVWSDNDNGYGSHHDDDDGYGDHDIDDGYVADEHMVDRE